MICPPILIFLWADGCCMERAQEASQRWISHVALFTLAWAPAGILSLRGKCKKYSRCTFHFAFSIYIVQHKKITKW